MLSAGLTQGSVHGALAGLVKGYCLQQGISPPKACEQYGPGDRMPFIIWQQILHEVARQDGRIALGLAIAQNVEPGHVGILAYLGLSCDTLGEALQRFEHYHRLAYDGNHMQIRNIMGVLDISWSDDAGRPGQLVDETAIGILFRIMTQLVAPNPLALVAVKFVNAPPASTRAYQQFFGCPVSFNTARTGIQIRAEYLALPLARHDAALRIILDRQAEALLAELPQPNMFDQSLQQHLIKAVHEGQVQIEQVAQQFGLSPRALQRRLMARGYTYQQRLAQVRQTLAEQYLHDSSLTLADIALLLGYSEQSAFQRAFKQWTGKTPNQCRSEG